MVRAPIVTSSPNSSDQGISTQAEPAMYTWVRIRAPKRRRISGRRRWAGRPQSFQIVAWMSIHAARTKYVDGAYGYRTLRSRSGMDAGAGSGARIGAGGSMGGWLIEFVSAMANPFRLGGDRVHRLRLPSDALPFGREQLAVAACHLLHGKVIGTTKRLVRHCRTQFRRGP